MFTAIRSTEEEPDFAPAASPRLPRSTSPWPPYGKCEPVREFPNHRNGRGRTAPGRIRQVQAGSVIKGRITPVPRVLLSVTLTGPTPSDGAGASRLCRGCFHPSWHLPGRAAPSSLTPAASGTRVKVSHLHSNHSASWRTAVFTDSPLPMRDVEADHRRHAIIEQVIADLKNGPLAHLPSGRFNANGAWLVLASMAFNLTRATGALASRFHARATTATIRAQTDQRPSAAGPLRPTHPPPPASQLAMGHRLPRPIHRRRRATTSHCLTTRPAGRRPEITVETPDRPAMTQRPETDSATPKINSAQRNSIGASGLSLNPWAGGDRSAW
jgi:hypothetical protein